MTGRSTRASPAPAPLLVAEPKDKRAAFEAFTKGLEGDDAKGEAITQKAKKADKKADEADKAASTESTEA